MFRPFRTANFALARLFSRHCAFRFSAVRQVFGDELSLQTSQEIIDLLKSYRNESGSVPVELIESVRPIINELGERVKSLSVRGYTETIQTAYSCKFYELVLKIFDRRLVHFSSSLQFTVYDFVVDSAFHLGSADRLVELADICFTKLRGSRNEVFADISLLRCMWRLLCLANSEQMAEQARADARLKAKDVLIHYVLADKAFKVVSADVDEAHEDEKKSEDRKSNNELFLLLSRIVLYARGEDRGEAEFFRSCKLQGLFRATHPDCCAEICGEVFYSALIRTCHSGLRGDIAWAYFEEFQNLPMGKYATFSASAIENGIKPLSAEILEIPGDNTLIEGVLGEALQEHSETGKDTQLHISSVFGAQGDDSGKSHNGFSELIIHCLLSVFFVAEDHFRIVDLAKLLLEDDRNAKLSVGVLAAFAASAGVLKDSALAIKCYGLMEQKNTSEIFSDPRGFVSVYRILVGIARCHVDNFYTDYLTPCLNKRIISTDAEVQAYLLLTDALGAADPTEAVTHVLLLADVDGGASLSFRVGSLLLRLLLRCEGDTLLTVYKMLLDKCGLFSPVWASVLVQWAARRRYRLSPEEKTYVLKEAELLLKEKSRDKRINAALSELKRDITGAVDSKKSVENCESTKETGTQDEMNLHNVVVSYDSRLEFMRQKRCVKVTNDKLSVEISNLYLRPLLFSNESETKRSELCLWFARKSRFC